MKPALVSVAALLALLACQPSIEPPVSEPIPSPTDASRHEEAATRADTAAREFSQRLQGALRGKMESEGPVAAIDFCHAEAPLIAAEIAAAHDVRIGRVPVPGRARNPANVADGWQAQALREIVARKGAGQAGEALAFSASEGLPGGVALRMMRPIEVQPACLACHGKQVAPPIRDAIAARYLGDAATGFEVGDLRGALWVEVPSR